MEKYNLLMELNQKQMLGEVISDKEKRQAVSVFLNGVSNEDAVLRYKNSMRVNPENDNMYPNYFIPPYNGGKKLRLIQGYMPKTHILYANHYELEILRLLYLFEPGNPVIKEMVEGTLQRLKRTCFGNSCTQGECFATGISVLRFLTVVCPDDTEWVNKLSEPLKRVLLSYENTKAKVWQGIPISYLHMALEDIGSEK